MLVKLRCFLGMSLSAASVETMDLKGPPDFYKKYFKIITILEGSS
ncbi:hypothetical protein FTV88_2742 [Heliorestis convoluta]|uniref:Uncharacterized protein n=1 Tax=Heliorestis convoluta TaxID=356322 RepID=A0A5Q2N3E9_9FIRM|nr:hypothetical protein FTV88_2742 [Heliorestis convoluta]